jgi:hypothetical protein
MRIYAIGLAKQVVKKQVKEEGPSINPSKIIGKHYF